MPAAMVILTDNPVAVLGALAGIGGICLLRVKKDKKIEKEYGIDGKPLPKDFPHSELIRIKLWENTNTEVPDYSIASSEGFPRVIPALQQN